MRRACSDVGGLKLGANLGADDAVLGHGSGNAAELLGCRWRSSAEVLGPVGAGSSAKALGCCGCSDTTAVDELRDGS